MRRLVRPMGEPGTLAAGELAGAGLRVGVLASRYNHDVTQGLLAGALEALREAGVADDDVRVAWVPGAFELPLVARRLACSGTVDAVVCLGAVIRGETAHFEYVAASCAEGLLRVSLDADLPVAFGVLTVNTQAQADARAGPGEGNKGREAALGALEVALLLRKLPTPEA